MRTMKDSGIEWIGEIPESWTFIKGKFLFTERNERGNKNTLQLLSPTQKYGVIPQSLYEELSGMKAVKLDEKTDYNTMKSIYNGDFCISLRSFQGGFEYSEYDGVVSPAYHVFYKTEDLCNAYYRYLFKEQGFISKMASLTKTFRDGKSIAFTDFADSLIPVPPLPEQQKISTYLDRQCGLIDSVIEKTKASIEEYKKLRQAVITQAVTKGVRGDRPMKDSGIEWIGEIPQEWEKMKMKSICSFHNGDRSQNYPSPEEFVEQGIPFIGADSLNGLSVDCSTAKRISAMKYEQMGGLKIQNQDILYTLRGSTIGKNSMAEFNGGTVASSLMGIRIIEKHLYLPRYILYYLNSQNEFIQRDICINGSTAPNLSAEDVKQFIVIIPDVLEQKEITEYLDKKCTEIDTLITKKEQFLIELESYKKSMIYEYVTGKKEVPQA